MSMVWLGSWRLHEPAPEVLCPVSCDGRAYRGVWMAANWQQSGEVAISYTARMSPGRLGRQPYYPQWGDEKHRQALYSAARAWFDEERAKPVADQVLSEAGHRARRDGSPNRPAQPYPDAEFKVWYRIARVHGQADLLEHLRGVKNARTGSGTIKLAVNSAIGMCQACGAIN